MANLTEESLVLYPASYNRRGLLGDFEVFVLSDGVLESLSGRQGPYTSIGEYFASAGESLLGKPPESVIAALRPGVDASGKISGSQGSRMMLYKITREQADELESLEGLLSSFGDALVI